MNPLSERLRLTKSDLRRIKETPEKTNVYGGSDWLRGLDLNQRPSGYELNVDVLTDSDARWSGCSVVSECVGPPLAVVYCTN